MNRKYTYEDLLEIIRVLRGENGCPWDKVQTHESLKPCMMEEAAELLASTSGLGYMIQVSRNLGRADLVMVGMLTIGMIGALLTVALEMLEKIFVRGKAK